MEIITKSFLNISKYPTLKDAFEYIYESVNYDDVVISDVKIRRFDKDRWYYSITYIRTKEGE